MRINHLGTFFLLILTSCLGKKAHYNSLAKEIKHESSYIISNVSLFNGIDSILFEAKDVWVKDGKIAEIRNHEIGNTLGIQKIDGSGKYLIPGFIDTHVHIMASGSTPWEMVRPNPSHNLEAWLAAGVTTVYDLGGIVSQTKRFKNKVEKGETKGPTIYFTGSPITSPGGHPIPASKSLLPFPLSTLVGLMIESVDRNTDIPKLIKKYQSDGVDYIKIINDQLPEGSPQIDQEVMKKIISESHQNNLKVFVHIGNGNDLISSVEAGADVIAHFPYRGILSKEDVDKIHRSKAKVIHTLTGFENTYQIGRRKYQPTELDKRMHPIELTGPATRERGAKINETNVLREFTQTLSKSRTDWSQSLQLLQEQKVPFTIGTDSPLPGSYAGSSFHEELIRLKNEGYSSYELLKAATSVAAKLFIENPSFGTLAKGQYADMVILNQNPFEEIENTSDIHLIIKRGTIYEPTY